MHKTFYMYQKTNQEIEQTFYLCDMCFSFGRFMSVAADLLLSLTDDVQSAGYKKGSSVWEETGPST